MSSYQPNIPTGLLNLSVDYQNIQTNFQQLDTSFGIDHLPFSNNTAQNGYHKDIHFKPLASTPSAIAGFGQLFTKTTNDGINSDQVLYYLSGGGNNIQLTRNFQPTLATNGYTFLPGGLILQWGKVSSTSSGLVTFATANIAFPNNCFLVNTQPFFNGSAPNGGANVAVKLNTTVSFNWSFFTNSGSYNGFYWIALGN